MAMDSNKARKAYGQALADLIATCDGIADGIYRQTTIFKKKDGKLAVLEFDMEEELGNMLSSSGGVV